MSDNSLVKPVHFGFDIFKAIENTGNSLIRAILNFLDLEEKLVG